ncbi:MAG: hypothetical protein WBC22_15355, partial [Sedimentisphaerales bacterium]
ADINAILVDTNELQIDWVNGGRLDLLIDAIKAVTDNLPDSGALNDLAAILTDTGTTLPTTLAAINALVDDLESRLTAARAGYLDELTAANIPADIDTLLARITAAVALASVCTEARLAELDAANLPADVDAALADTNELQTDDYPTSIAAIKAETALIVADTNELQVDDYPTSIAAVQTAVDAVKAETALIVADTNELQTDDYPTSIAAIKAETALIVADTNELQVDDYPTSIAAIKAETALIVADTDELQTDWANGGRLDLILDAILAMLDDARTEPGDTAPPVNPDAMTKIDYLYKFLRNKIMTSATRIDVYNDAGDNIDHSSTISDDDTDFTRGEFGAGA